LLDSAVISVSILQGDYARACARVEELIAADLRIAITAVSAALRSDLTLCLAALGKDEEAQHNLELIPDSQLDALNSDDRALALESLARACDCMTLGEKGRGYRARRDSALLEHDQEVAQVRAAIAPLVDANAVIGRTAARSA
jgi:hypothetical protein